jgi:hypothetical protein
MKKGAKRATLVVGSALAFTLLAGALLSRPSPPFAFLDGAVTTVARVDTYHFPGPGSTPVPTKVFIMRFVVDRPFESVAHRAASELSAQGWETIVVDEIKYADLSLGMDQLVQIREKDGATHVRVFKRSADWQDRLQAWVWSISNDVPKIDNWP